MKSPVTIAFALVLSGYSATAAAQVVFEDTFDSLEDWSPEQTAQGASNSCRSNGGCTLAPPGYAGYRVATSLYANAGHNTLNIDSSNHRGAAGKALTFWAEVCDSCGFNASDGLLDIRLAAAGYQAIYVRWFMRFDPAWVWNRDLVDGPMQKFIHISSYDESFPGNTNPYDFFPGDADGSANNPIFVASLAKWFGGTGPISYMSNHIRFGLPGIEVANDAFPGPDGRDCDWSEPGCPGDGDWHSWEFYLALNTADGVADGVESFWFDGRLVRNQTDVVWVTGSDPQNHRWNYVWLGGNNFNHYAPQADEPEQFYSIDDVVVSTEYIGPDYTIGGTGLGDAGAGDAGAGDAGAGDSGAGDSGAGDAGAGDAGAGDAGAGDSGAGCACHAAASVSAAPWALALFPLLLVCRRRTSLTRPPG